jgi:hypothetical protein
LWLPYTMFELLQLCLHCGLRKFCFEVMRIVLIV